MMVDIIIDLETLGMRPGSAILEIGAVPVLGGKNIDEDNALKVCVDTHDATMAHGFDVDVETMDWWRNGTRSALFHELLRDPDRRTMQSALETFDEWLRNIRAGQEMGVHKLRIWGNGASFDLGILAEAHRKMGMSVPWDYRVERDVRTALDICGVSPIGKPWIEAGPRHDALFDALHEARLLTGCGALEEQK